MISSGGWGRRAAAAAVGVLVAGGVVLGGTVAPATAEITPPPPGCPVVLGVPSAVGDQGFEVPVTPLAPSEDCTATAVVSASLALPGHTAVGTVTGLVNPSARGLPQDVFFGDVGPALVPTCPGVDQPARLTITAGSQQVTTTVTACSTVTQLPGELYRSDGEVGIIARSGSYTVASQLGSVATPTSPLVSTPGEDLVGLASAGSSGGYVAAGADGGVFAYDTGFYGSAAGLTLNAPIAGIATTPDGKGYWLVGEDGGVFAYGDAVYEGSAATLPLAAPIVGIAATGDGGGYWLVGEDGGVFAFGDAVYQGSAGAIPLASPIVGISHPAGAAGYQLAAADGGVFAFDAPFDGSAAGLPLQAPVAGIADSPSGNGYWLVGADGGIFAFGDAPYLGPPETIRVSG